jgi:hypothetical protein
MLDTTFFDLFDVSSSSILAMENLVWRTRLPARLLGLASVGVRALAMVGGLALNSQRFLRHRRAISESQLSWNAAETLI